MTAPIRLTDEPEYVLVQPGLGGVAWLGEVIDGELSPIGKVSDILAAERALVERVAKVRVWAVPQGYSCYPDPVRPEAVEMVRVDDLRAALAPSSTENREGREVEYRGLTHSCTDESCHVPAFLNTLRRLDEECDR